MPNLTPTLHISPNRKLAVPLAEYIAFVLISGKLSLKGCCCLGETNNVPAMIQYLKTRGGIFITVLLLTLVSAKAFSPKLDGTMMPYDFTSVDSVVPWNKNLKPAFVYYVARHGARFLSSEKKIASLRATLTDAEAHGCLTQKGESFLRLINMIDSVTAGRWGALDEVGIEEEQRLGRELTAICPELFEKGKVSAVSTYVPRVVMTMYEVCHQLAAFSSHIEVSTSEGRQYDSLLRFFKTDKEYEDYIDHGPWRFAFDNFRNRNIPVRPAAEMINSVMPENRLRDMTEEAYGILQSLNAAGIETDPDQWFTEGEYRKCWEVDNLEHYYQRSVSLFSPIAANSAIPLLEDLIAKTDFALSHPGELSACLRFGHAETLIPLFSLMRLPGCYAPQASPDKVRDVWQDFNVSPLGANLLVVTLKDEAGDNYVALRLNGKWVATQGKMVIPWNELKNILTAYCSKL